MQQGGRFGRHSEHLGHLLSELQIDAANLSGAACDRGNSTTPNCGSAPGIRGERGRSGDSVLTIADLGVLRDVAVNDGRVEVAITPTYSGCPAMNMITLEIELALEREGFSHSKVRTVLSPAWTTDWMSEDGRRKLAEYGIAPPLPQAPAARCSRRARSVARNGGSRYRGAVRVRLDFLQGAVALQELREPFELFQMPLTSRSP